MILKKTIITACLALISTTSWSIDIPKYVNTDANRIIMNNDNWDLIKNELNNVVKSDSAKFNILHIGDSHIQADFSTTVVRRLLQTEYGNAGRGCIAALRLAKTNQPVDYTITSTSDKWIPTRLLRRPWSTKVGITGVAALPEESAQTITITTKFKDDAFNRITLLHAPSASYDNITINKKDFNADINANVHASTFHIPTLTDSITINCNGSVELYGVNILNDKKGIVYHAIGNNGACFSDYNIIPQFARQTVELKPSLIILSMGTNEAFGNQSDNTIYANIKTLITRLSSVNPNAKFLLLTPMECQKNRKHGQKKLSEHYDINHRVKEVRNIILKFGSENNIPTWDLYEIAGGDNASTKWLGDKLMNKDRIHCLKAGYEVQGTLLFQSLLEQLK